tara:strand:- start:332 stop:457 length:126 start_codon:yes stop_codon:yes gene_type:complete
LQAVVQVTVKQHQVTMKMVVAVVQEVLEKEEYLLRHIQLHL